MKISEAWLSRPQKPGKYWDGRYGGLGVRVWADGHNKTWIFQKSGGTQRALGRFPTIQVPEARKLALDFNGAVGPRPSSVTLEAVHETWQRDLLTRGKSERTAHNRSNQFYLHAKPFLQRDPNEITPIELLDFRTKLAEHSVHVARDVTGHVVNLINMATERKIRLPDLPRPKEKTRRQIDDIGEWWADVKAAGATQQMKDALAFAALTGLRENEIIQARRSHIRNGWLHIPKPKGGTDLAFDRHVPTQCLDLIGRQLSNDQIFPFYKIRIKGLASTHACRHYFLGYIEAALGAPRRVTRALVNHTGKTDVTDGYGRVLPEVHAEWSQKAADAIADRMGWCL